MKKIVAIALSLFWVCITISLLLLQIGLNGSLSVLDVLLFLFIFVLSLGSGWMLYSLWDSQEKKHKVLRILSFFLPLIPGVFIGFMSELLLFFKKLQ